MIRARDMVVAGLPLWPDLLSDGFGHDGAKQTPWAAFIRRDNLTGLLG